MAGVRLPIEGWVSYTVDRFICTIDRNNRAGTTPALYLGCHVMLHYGNPAVEFDANANRAGIEEIVKGLVEAARIAYNASEYEEGASDSTLVPKSCILYLDNAVNHLVVTKYNIQRYFGIDQATWQVWPFGDEFKDAWLDCMIFLRAIRNQYCDIIKDNNTAVETSIGTPQYFLTNASRRDV
jgi:hypothetical protein